MFVSEEELAVQVREIDGIEVDDAYLPKAAEDEVLEQFAADAARAHHEHTCLCECCQPSPKQKVWKPPEVSFAAWLPEHNHRRSGQQTYLLDVGIE